MCRGFRITTRLLGAACEEFIEQCPCSSTGTLSKLSCPLRIACIQFSLNERSQVIHAQARVRPLGQLLASYRESLFLFHVRYRLTLSLRRAWLCTRRPRSAC